MSIKKIGYIPASKLSDDDRKRYNIKQEDKFAQVIVSNPDKGMEVRGVKSAIREVKKSFSKKELKGFRL